MCSSFVVSVGIGLDFIRMLGGRGGGGGGRDATLVAPGL